MKFGAQAERAAEQWLALTKQYTPLAHNVRCPGGEVDLIMQEGDEYVFIEVKARTSTAYGTAAESITKRKITSMMRCAEWYFLQQKMETMPYFRLEAVFVENGRFTHLPDLTLE